MRSTSWFLVAAAAAAVAFTGCRSDEPRELERGQGDTWVEEEAEGGAGQRAAEPSAAPGEEAQDRPASHALDGRTYMVTLIVPGEEALSDELVFEDGTFDSTACHAEGFGSAPYQVQEGAMDEGQRFSATTRSGEKSIAWDGQVIGDRIVGTALKQVPGEAPVRCTFEGQVKGE